MDTSEGHILGWIGAGCAQPAVIKTVRRTLRDGQPRQIRITPKADGGEVQPAHCWFVSSEPKARVAVFAAATDTVEA